jgi:hypothetical protein
MPMETYMKVAGRMIRQMGKESFWIQIMQDMKETGLMTCNMVTELRLGTMILLNILANSIKERSRVKVDLNGKMAATMTEISFKDSSKASVNITLQI